VAAGADYRTLCFNPEGGIDSRRVNFGRASLAARITAASGCVFELDNDRMLWIGPSGRDHSWRLIDTRGRPSMARQRRARRTSGWRTTRRARDGSSWRGTFAF